MKFKVTLGLVLVMISVFATSSFAQINVSVNNSSVSPGEVATNRHAATSDTSIKANGLLISGALIAASALTNTNIRLTFPGPITSSTTVPVADPIRIMGNVGIFATAAISTINFTAGTIDLILPTIDNSAGASGSFRLVGVRTDVNGKTGAQTANVGYSPGSSGANNYLLSTTPAQLISSVAAGSASPVIGAVSGQQGDGTILVFNNLAVADAKASVVLAEGFASAWKTSTQASTSALGLANDTGIRITLRNVPPGMTATITPLLITSGNTVTLAAGSGGITTTAYSATTAGSVKTATFTFGSTDLTKVESIQFNITLNGVPTAATAGNSITADFTFVPVGDALLADATAGTPTEVGGFPRFSDSAASITVGTIVQATTTMLIPYVAKGFDLYDTGIAISNTTLDPFGGATAGGALPTAGALTLTIYQRGSTTPIVLSTATLSASQASGIDSGKIPAGGVFTASLSQLLPSSAAADFVGYAFVQADFLNAHGISYLIEKGSITGAVPLLVMNPPNGATPRNGTEILGN